MPRLINNTSDAALQLANAMASDGTDAQAQALRDFAASIADSVRADYEELASQQDVTIMAQRGIRQLTSRETKFYEGLTKALRSDAPQQSFADFLTADANGDNYMPETIIEDVYRNLEQDHELLQVIDFNYTGYMTKWLRNKHRIAKAVWGSITGTITEEIKSEFEWMRIDQNKLTAFAVIPLDILDMGYAWVDAYIRRCLAEAVFEGLEDGIVNGKGVNNEPCGLIRDVHRGVTISSTEGYPAKTAVKLANFGHDYLAKVAIMAKTESWTDGDKTYGGKPRKVPNVIFIANTQTMITKAKAALLFVGNSGYNYSDPAYATQFVECNSLEDNKAILLVPGCYTFCVGGKRNGTIEFSDEFKFLDDARTFRIVQHGDGIAEDDTAVMYLDVTDLDTEAIPVKVTEKIETA